MRVWDWFAFFAGNQPEAAFAVQGERTVTWREAHDRAVQLGDRLAGCGVGRGQRFGYLSKNSIEMAIAYVGAARTGAVPVPLNYRLAPVEWAYILDDARCGVVLVESAFTDALDEVRGELGAATELVIVDGAGRDGWAGGEEWLAGPHASTDTPTADDVLYQMYTSGTTGRPKGVLLSHRNVLANLDQVGATWSHRLDPGDRMLVCAPMYHASGGLGAMAAARWGVTLLIHADFDPAAVVDALAEGGVTNTTLVPVMIQACLAVSGVEERDFSRLRTISYGAAPMSEPLMVRAQEVLGCELVQGFGQTEATSCITMLTGADHAAARAGRADLLGSVGRPLPGTEVRVVDATSGVPCGPGDVGEILARGPQVMQGYWNAAEQTASTLRDGWLHTGDAGYLDAEGYLYIQDRIKDMIVTGGSNVYSVEVEQVIATHPAVAEVAVIGVPDERWGETVLALVVPKPGERLDLEALQAHCRKSLGGYKVPRQLELVDALPRNPSGKVLKHILREPYWEGRTRRVG